MLRLAPQAAARLSDEAQLVADLFLAAVPPALRKTIRCVRLFGPQARRYEAGQPFDLLVLADERTLAMKSAVSIASAAVEGEAAQSVFVTLVGVPELEQPSEHLQRALQNAEREGIDLWQRPGL